MRGGGAHVLRHYVFGQTGKPWVHVLRAGASARAHQMPECGWEALKVAGYVRRVPVYDTGDEGGTHMCPTEFEYVRTLLTRHLDVAACCKSLGANAPGGDFGNVGVEVF